MSTLVTVDNLDSLVYDASAGIQYELCEGCVRTMKRPTIGLDRAYSEIMKKENIAEVDTSSESYWANVRLMAVTTVTEGDKIPVDVESFYTEVINRVVADFLRLRYLKAAKPSKSLATTNETQQ